jgi:hypothetical protein
MRAWLALLLPLVFSCVRQRAAQPGGTTTTTTTTVVEGVDPVAYQPRGQGLAVDTTQREAVRAFFSAHYAPHDAVPSQYNGNVDLRYPGTTSPAFKAAIIDRINFYRAMAGVPADITVAEVESNKAQQAAMMMSAANALSHHPDTSWPNYTPEGAEAAANSNLHLGSRGPSAITGYMRDQGSNNAAVGHRRWILYPQTRTMGTGDVDGNGKYGGANALWVSEKGTYLGPRPPVRDGYVAWPPRGYVPYQVVFERWSLSYPKANFEAATVEMSRNGVPIALQSAPYVSNGYGENAMVWIPSGVAGPNWVMNKPETDVVFGVIVRNVQIDGQMREFSYTVTAFDPGTVVAPPPVGPPPAEWPANIPTPWGAIPTLKPSTVPMTMPTTFPTTFPSTIPTTWPLPTK